MTTAFFILAPFLTGLIGMLFIRSWVMYRLPYHESARLSEPAKKIILDARALPKSHRPDEIVSVVRALDTKYGVEELNHHFMRNGYEASYFSWNCDCASWSSHTRGDRSKCEYADVYTLHNELQGLKADLDAQAKAIEVAGVQDGLDQAELIMERLRLEREMVAETTKEITQ